MKYIIYFLLFALMALAISSLSSCATTPKYGTPIAKSITCKSKIKAKQQEIARAKKKVVVPYYARKK